MHRGACFTLGHRQSGWNIDTATGAVVPSLSGGQSQSLHDDAQTRKGAGLAPTDPTARHRNCDGVRVLNAKRVFETIQEALWYFAL